MKSHAGSIENPRSKAGRLFRVLKRRPGVLHTTLQLALLLDDPCVHTTVYEVRGQALARGWDIVCKTVPGRRPGGRKRYAYVAVKVGDPPTALPSARRGGPPSARRDGANGANEANNGRVAA